MISYDKVANYKPSDARIPWYESFEEYVKSSGRHVNIHIFHDE